MRTLDRCRALAAAHANAQPSAAETAAHTAAILAAAQPAAPAASGTGKEHGNVLVPVREDVRCVARRSRF